MQLNALLRLMTDKGASDLHLKPMRPPLLRIHGRLMPIDDAKLPTTAGRRRRSNARWLVGVGRGPVTEALLGQAADPVLDRLHVRAHLFGRNRRGAHA
ncbi:MAG: hypothetical protein ACE5EG_04560, partial [Thermoanaerobaculia bacterium]